MTSGDPSNNSPFVIKDHTFPGQHIREYPGALATHQEDVLTIAAKSYTPRRVAAGTVSGDLTVVAFHANAVPKETYEPLFEALDHQLRERHGINIGSIWIADMASQSSSAVINDGVLGNDLHWWDHARDVIQMVNIFRSQMKRPIFALGHSMGGTQAVATAHYHQRLFEGIILLDPSITMTHAPSLRALLRAALRRPETFGSDDEIRAYMQKHPMFKGWHPAALEKYAAAAFHTSPTIARPDNSIKAATTPLAELRGFTRPNVEHVAVAEPVTNAQRYTHPDVDADSPMTGPIYNPQTRQAYSMLPTLRPPVFFVLGSTSAISPKDEIEHRTSVTGTEPGGSGGVSAGNVACMTVEGGHHFPLSNVESTAEVSANWIAERLWKWRKVEAEFMQAWDRKDVVEKQRLEPKVVETLKKWDGKLWENPSALPDGWRSKL